MRYLISAGWLSTPMVTSGQVSQPQHYGSFLCPDRESLLFRRDEYDSTGSRYTKEQLDAAALTVPVPNEAIVIIDSQGHVFTDPDPKVCRYDRSSTRSRNDNKDIPDTITESGADILDGQGSLSATWWGINTSKDPFVVGEIRQQRVKADKLKRKRIDHENYLRAREARRLASLLEDEEKKAAEAIALQEMDKKLEEERNKVEEYQRLEKERLKKEEAAKRLRNEEYFRRPKRNKKRCIIERVKLKLKLLERPPLEDSDSSDGHSSSESEAEDGGKSSDSNDHSRAIRPLEITENRTKSAMGENRNGDWDNGGDAQCEYVRYEDARGGGSSQSAWDSWKASDWGWGDNKEVSGGAEVRGEEGAEVRGEEGEEVESAREGGWRNENNRPRPRETSASGGCYDERRVHRGDNDRDGRRHTTVANVRYNNHDRGGRDVNSGAYRRERR